LQVAETGRVVERDEKGFVTGANVRTALVDQVATNVKAVVAGGEVEWCAAATARVSALHQMRVLGQNFLFYKNAKKMILAKK
jgi:hypothetical protein